MPKALSLKRSGAIAKSQIPITQFFKNKDVGITNIGTKQEDVQASHSKRKAPSISPKNNIKTVSQDSACVIKSPKKIKREDNLSPISRVNIFNAHSEKQNCNKNGSPNKQDVKSLPLSPIKNGVINTKTLVSNGYGLSHEKSADNTSEKVDCIEKLKNHDSPEKLSPGKENSPVLFKLASPKKHVSPKNGTEVKGEVDVSNLFDDDWGALDMAEDCPEDLDLSTMQRCEIVGIQHCDTSIEIKLRNSLKQSGTCIIEGIWCDTPLYPGDWVSVIATRGPSGKFGVTNTSGLLVLRPDHLMSTTSVVAGVFCKRKAVLQERFKGIDSASDVMTLGILIHELVQKALTSRIVDVAKLRSEADILIKESIQMLYDAGLTVEGTKSKMEMYIMSLAEFMQMYMQVNRGSSMNNTKGKWNGHIDEVLDIEENVCCPKLGLKGKIDATLQVTIHERKGRKRSIMPLELKSGRASGSAEHRGQLVLYGMMLSLQRGCHPTEEEQRGLLLYLKDKVDLREVSCGYPEKRDLIMLRNQLVQYLSANPNNLDSESLTDIEEASKLLQQNLPEPVYHETACAKCPYLTLCSLHLWHTDGPTVCDGHPLVKLKEQALGHLSPEHVKYFLHWTSLLKMEERVQMNTSPLHALWTEEPDKRNKRGVCAAYLSLRSVVPSGERYLHVFQRSCDVTVDDLKSNKHAKGPQEGEFSIVSIENRPWIAAGVITLINGNEISIILERDLSRRLSKDVKYHIDTYESYATTVQNLTNLGAIMEDTDKAERLRSLIIDKNAPEFEEKLNREVGRLGTKLMKSLNIQQQRAVLKALAARKYALLQGLPGTGKTQTISVLIQMLVALKQRVLVTAHTHSAVDNVLTRLPSTLRIMRLGSAARVAPNLASRCEQNLVASCDTPETLERLYESMEVIGVTCLGSTHAMMSRTTFDVCIVDEATQVPQCTVLRPLLAAKKFVLVGDPDQLPPVVRSRAARRLGMEESLFHRLQDAGATLTLQLQYRMNQTLAELANAVAYSGRLKCANEAVRDATLCVDMQKIERLYASESPWLIKATSPELKDAASFIDMSLGEMKPMNKSCANADEACVVMKLVDVLKEGGVKPADIGIIAPYREQVALLKRSLLKLGYSQVEVSTVDQFQGRDKPVIVYSCTRCDEGSGDRVKDGEVLNDQRRLAVSVTRAKHKLLVVGNSRALRRYAPLQTMIKSCSTIVLSVDEMKNCVNKYSSFVT